MNLNFLGIGSAFQADLYNTSAYFIEDEKLFLIDFGETAFFQLQAQEFFSKIKEIYVVFTHTHSDHIGGISKLANHSYNILQKPLNIIIPSRSGLYYDILELLNIFNVPICKCNFLLPYEVYDKFYTFSSITFIPTYHTEILKGKCYSLVFTTIYGNVFYSGDTCEITNLEYFIKKPFYKIYIDSTLTIAKAHLSLDILDKIIPVNLRHKVFCMHFDSLDCLEKAKSLGFNIAKSTSISFEDFSLSFKYTNANEKDPNANSRLIIFDNCGELAFTQILQYNLLKHKPKICLSIQNTNSENVASLGSLLSYSYFVLKKPVFISCNKELIPKLIKLEEIYGVPNTAISFITDFSYLK